MFAVVLLKIKKNEGLKLVLQSKKLQDSGGRYQMQSIPKQPDKAEASLNICIDMPLLHSFFSNEGKKECAILTDERINCWSSRYELQ